jgi:hypothetical protein
MSFAFSGAVRSAIPTSCWTRRGGTQDAKKRLLSTEAFFESRLIFPVRERHAPLRSPEVCPSRRGTLWNSQERRSVAETGTEYFLR